MRTFIDLLRTTRSYRSDEIDEFIEDSGVLEAKLYKDQSKREVYNVPAAFDIETSSFYEDGKKRACMYIWMLGINGLCMTGRTWEEFIAVCDTLTDRLGLGDSRQLFVYVHNLEFEFQFIRHRFEWKKVFATGPRTPAYALTTGGICFRCSYILSGYALASVGRSLTRYRVDKMVGDLDYRLMRHSGTPLTEKEIGYCLNDIRVVMAYIQEHIENDGNITKVLITKTSYIRQLCREATLHQGKGHKENGLYYLKIRQLIGGLQETPEEYQMQHRAFQGGFTHASFHYSGKTLENVGSDDLTSAYPYQIVAQKFPMSSGTLRENVTMKDFRKYLRCYCCIFDIEIIGLVAKEEVYEHPISCSKCWKLDPDHIEDNGKLVEAAYLRTTITDVDFQIYEQFYNWESIRLGKFYTYRRGRLPKDLIKAVLQLYRKKTELKGVAGSEQEYSLAKENLNSVFGSIVTDIVRPEIEYSDEWTETEPDLVKSIEKYNRDRKRYLFYPWGIFVTAYNRRTLFEAIKAIGPDYVYSDTDSVKYVNPDRHQKFFEGANELIFNRAMKTVEYYGLDPELIRPKTIKGKEKKIGVWDFEGIYLRFKTLGAKRYMTETEDAISITVSGVNKRTAVPYLCRGWAYELRGREERHSPFKLFDDSLIVPPGASGKLTHTYIDDEHSGDVVDYLGNPGHYLEYSAVHMEPAAYELSLASRYVDYLLGIRERTK